MNEDNKVNEAVDGCETNALVFVNGILFMFLNALYLKLAWGWVVMPLFGVHSLSYWSAFAMMMFIDMFIKHRNAYDKIDISKIASKMWIIELGLTLDMFILWLVSFAL